MLVTKCEYMLLTHVRKRLAMAIVNNTCEKSWENYSQNPTYEVLDIKLEKKSELPTDSFP